MPYLTAKAHTGSKHLHSAIILSNPDGGVDLYLIEKQGDTLLPLCSSRHDSEAAAKADVAESMQICEADWVIHDGEPEWAGAVRSAVKDAIDRVSKAVKESN